MENFHLIRKKDEHRLNNLTTEADLVNGSLRNYRENFIQASLAKRVLFKTYGTEVVLSNDYETLLSGIRDEMDNFKGYYNDDLEIDYSRLTKDFGFNVNDVTTLKDDLIKYYRDQQISVNIFKTKYCNESKLVEDASETFDDFFKAAGFEIDVATEIRAKSSHHRSNKSSKGHVRTTKRLRYMDQVDRGVEKFKNYLRTHTEGPLDTNLLMDQFLNGVISAGDVESAMKINSHGLSGTQLDRLVKFLDDLKEHYDKVHNNTGYIVQIEKNNFLGQPMAGTTIREDSLISVAYISDGNYGPNSQFLNNIMALCVAVASESLSVGKIASKLGISTELVEELGLKTLIEKLNKDLIKGIGSAAGEEITKEQLEKIIKNHQEKILNPMKKFVNAFNEVNKNAGISPAAKRIGGQVNSLVETVGTVITILSITGVAAVSGIGLPIAILSSAIKIGVEMFQTHDSIENGKELYKYAQRSPNFDFENRMREENLIKEQPFKLRMNSISGFSSFILDAQLTNTFIGDNNNQTIQVLDGDGNVVDAKGGEDRLISSPRGDILKGGAGDDTYVYKKGDGKDVIHDYHRLYSRSTGITTEVAAGEDTLYLKGIKESELQFNRVENDLVIAFKYSDEDQITIRDHFKNNSKIEYIKIDDSDPFIIDQWLKTGDNKGSTITGNNREEILLGGHGEDILMGNKGADILKGGLGEDTYIFKKGDGIDTIEDHSKVNSIYIHETLPEDLIITIKENDLYIQYRQKDDDKESLIKDQLIIKSYSRLRNMNVYVSNGEKIHSIDLGKVDHLSRFVLEHNRSIEIPVKSNLLSGESEAIGRGEVVTYSKTGEAIGFNQYYVETLIFELKKTMKELDQMRYELNESIPKGSKEYDELNPRIIEENINECEELCDTLAKDLDNYIKAMLELDDFKFYKDDFGRAL